MPVESISQRIQALPGGDEKEQLRALLGQLVDGIQAICAKLDLDATVTDTNYAAVFATFVRD